jgi:hypothetical protein
MSGEGDAEWQQAFGLSALVGCRIGVEACQPYAASPSLTLAALGPSLPRGERVKNGGRCTQRATDHRGKERVKNEDVP